MAGRGQETPPPVLATPGPVPGITAAGSPTPTPQTRRRRPQRAPVRQRDPRRSEEGRRRDTLRLLQWNADGIASKKVELIKYLHETQPDLVAIQESKLKASDDFSIPGYHVLRGDRRQGRRVDTLAGGGVATLVREGISFRCPVRSRVAPNDLTTA